MKLIIVLEIVVADRNYWILKNLSWIQMVSNEE